MINLQAGPMTRRRSNERSYIDYRKSSSGGGCIFCSRNPDELGETLDETENFYVISNKFPYDLWDGCEVIDHLMAIPKSHVAALSQLPPSYMAEFQKIIAKYEEDNYSLYARAPKNITKSVLHQHTHLIKIGDKRKKMLFYIRRPHILW